MEISTLKGLMIERGIVKAKLIDQMKMSKSTFYLKMKNPETFTLEEMNNLAVILECELFYLIALFGRDGHRLQISVVPQSKEEKS